MGSAMPQNGPTPNPPVYPRWSFENSVQDPRVLQEHQLSWYTVQLEVETSEHNATRTKLQRYISQALTHERAFCTERYTNKRLNEIIINLRDELEEERSKLAEVEEELRGTHNMLGVTFIDNADINWSPKTPKNENPRFNEEEPVHLALSDDEGEMEDLRGESNPKVHKVNPGRISKH